MHRIALRIEYDGTDFLGWQIQPQGRTVQAVLISAIKQAFASRPGFPFGASSVVGAGRTDSGVHARGQVVHFDLMEAVEAVEIRDRLNRALPPDCRVREAAPVPAAFHARRDARTKRYAYHLSDRDAPVIDRRAVAWHPSRLDETRMQEAARLWLGKHDFSSFRSPKCEAKSPVRSLDRLDISRGDHLVITAEAPSFLHHQIRIMVGTLVEIGRGAQPVEWATALLEAHNRSQAGPTMPALGLCLEHVGYTSEIFCA